MFFCAIALFEKLNFLKSSLEFCSFLFSRHRRSYFWLLHYSRGVSTAGSAACLLWQIFTADALPDSTPKGFVSPPETELGIFHLLDE